MKATHLGLLMGALAAWPYGVPVADAAETRSYVVNWFYEANYNGGDADCPKGLNPSAIEFYRRDLRKLGLTGEKVEELLKDFPGEGGLTQPWIPYVMTRGNGKDNVYANPSTAADPGLRTIEGRYAYGFNLDGQESSEDFVEAVTHERGIDNQAYRAMGCIRSMRAQPDMGPPGLSETQWDTLRTLMPAWVISITAPHNFKTPGEVTITLTRALETVTRDPGGRNAQLHMTYQMDPDPRFMNVVKGILRDGVVTTSPVNVRMAADLYIMPEFRLNRAQLRLNMNADGSLAGIIGGYQPWYDIYFGIANRSYIKEYAASIDVPGLYYVLKRHADGDPDPKTGDNTTISASYVLKALPAYVVPAELKSAQYENAR